MRGKGSAWSDGLLWLTLALVLFSLYLVFLYVPTEREMGIVQRVFYYHVPLAWIAFLAFFVVFIGSVLYLWKREARWDRLARSSGQVGIVFTTLVLITGPIWARPAWGVWWTWDARLTTTLVLWLIYQGYLLVRAFATDPSRGARFAAVVGIVGFADVPLVFLATTWWRTQHPTPIVFQGGLTPSMLFALIVSVVTFTLLYLVLLRERLWLREAEEELNTLRQEQL